MLRGNPAWQGARTRSRDRITSAPCLEVASAFAAGHLTSPAGHGALLRPGYLAEAGRWKTGFAGVDSDSLNR